MVLETSATDEASLEIAAGLLALVKGREVAKQGQQEDLKQVFLGLGTGTSFSNWKLLATYSCLRNPAPDSQ